MENAAVSPFFRDLADRYESSLLDQKQIELPIARGERDDTPDITLFKVIRAELYSLFCTKSTEYDDLRNANGGDTKAITMFVCGAAATALASAGLSLPVITIAAAVSLLLRMTLTVGTRALCRYASLFGLSEV